MMNFEIFLSFFIPLLGTALGALMVFFVRINPKFQNVLLGIASGVMISASIWSLLIPALNYSNDYLIKWLPASIGFTLGIFCLMLIDFIFPKIHKDASNICLFPQKKKNFMLFSAITIHNIPEGMAVGVIFASASSLDITFASALIFTIGIAIQNFPEGAIISMPLKIFGHSKRKAFAIGLCTGIVEPIFAIITFFLATITIPAMPFLLSFASGAMFYVVLCELIPEIQETSHSNFGIIGVCFGFVLMMILDISF